MATGTPSSVSGHFGGGVTFASGSQALTKTAATGLPLGSAARSLEFWTNIPSSASFVAALGYGGTNRYELQPQPLNGTGPNVALLPETSPNVWNQTFDGNWHLYAVSNPGGATSANAALYVDGAANTSQVGGYSGDGTLLNTSGATLRINGYPTDGTNGAAFTIDEARISNLQRTAAWYATQFANQSNPSTFFNLGAVN